jgi:predicted outer membrane protein
MIAGFAGAGCRAKESPAMSTAAGTVSGAESTANVAPPSTTVLSDAAILALLDEANTSDSSGAAMASSKATRRDVKAYAKLAIGDHHALHAQGDQVATEQHLTPALPANDPFKAAITEAERAEAAAPKGRPFDSTYIAQEIGIHRSEINWTTTAETAAQNQAVKNLIKIVIPALQKHLEKAEAIAKEFTKTTA